MTRLASSDTLEQYREIFEEIEDIILIVEKDGRIDYVNRALRNLLGYPERRYTGKTLCEAFSFKESKIDCKIFLKQLFHTSTFVSQIKNREEETLYLSWKTKPFYQKKKRKLLAIIRNITPEIRLQKKTEEYSENLQEMVIQRTRQLEREKQKAVDLHQAKAVFLSKMSHELRTPLTAICGYIELVQESRISKQEEKKYLGIIDRNARGLLSMINETLDMVKIEQNKFPVNERSFSLLELLNEIYESFLVLASEKQLKFKVVTSPGVPERIYSDPNAIRQILNNLLGNAIKFTSSGQVTLKVKQRSFPLKMSQKLYFYVEDSGLGIPQEYHQRVFRSFEQYLDQRVVPERGTGLGLSISRQMAKLLGGNVKLLSSDTNEGSTFVFSLPLRSMKRQKNPS